MIDVDVVVLGGGPAGVAAAREAARQGMAVALVDAEGPGGRAARTTTMPARILGRAADAGKADWPVLRGEIVERAASWSGRLALVLEDAGVELFRSHARFEGPNSLALDDGRTITFERAIIASGAEPACLPGPAPDGERLLTPDQLAELSALPAEVMVVGGGAAGAEIVDTLSRMGSTVTWVMDELGLLPSFDRELAEAVGDVLMTRGVKLVHGKRVLEVGFGEGGTRAVLDGGRTYAAPVGVVAIGNRPRVEGLSALGVRVDALGAIVVDERGLTSAAHVFAAGDVTGRTHDVASAEAMGRVAGLGAAGVEARYEQDVVPRVAYTTPQIAQVGLGADRAAGREVMLHTLRLEETITGHLARIGESQDAKGFVRLICDSSDGRLLGASALGPGAVEAVSAAALALSIGATDSQLAHASASVPSALEAIVRALR